MKPKILANVAFFKNFLFFQTFLKFARTGSHPELPFTPKSVAFSGILEKYSVAIFVSGKENYPEILEKIITKQVGLNRNVC